MNRYLAMCLCLLALPACADTPAPPPAPATPATAAPATAPVAYNDPVPHDVITEPYTVAQGLSELTARINNLYRKPFQKTLAPDRTMQVETVIFPDTTTGHEIIGFTRELCADIAHGDLARPAWTIDGRLLLFQGNRVHHKHDGQLVQRTWEGNKFIMNADGTAQQPLVVRFLDAQGNVESTATGIEGKFNILDRRNPRLAYYAIRDKLWQLTLASDPAGPHQARLVVTLATEHRKIIQDISRDGKLLIQDLNADLDRATRKPLYMPHIHLVDLNKKPGDNGFYHHHPFDWGLPEVRSPDGKVLHAADNNYQFHSLKFGKTSDTVVFNYGPMTSVGEYLGWTLDIRNGLEGPPVHGPIGNTSGVNAFGQYESHGRIVGPTTIGLYFSGPANLPDGQRVGSWGLWMRDYAQPDQAPHFLMNAAGGHVAGGESLNPHYFAAHIGVPSAQWRRNVKESDGIVWGDVREMNARLAAYTYSDLRGGTRVDRATGKLIWSGQLSNDFRPYRSIPRPLLSPDATKCLFHSSMLMPLDTWVGMYVVVLRRPDPPTALRGEALADGVRLTWEAPPAAHETRRYRIWRSTDGAEPIAIATVDARPYAERAGAYTFTDRAPAGVVRYAATAEEWSGLESDRTSPVARIDRTPDAARDPADAQEAAWTHWDKTPPASPGDFTVRRDDEPGQYRLTWAAPHATHDVRHYHIYYSAAARPEINASARIASPPAGLTAFLDWSAPVDPGLKPTYAITAVDRQGNESTPVFAQP